MVYRPTKRVDSRAGMVGALREERGREVQGGSEGLWISSSSRLCWIGVEFWGGGVELICVGLVEG